MTSARGPVTSARSSWGPPKILIDALEALPCLEEPALLHECARQVGRALGVTIAVPDSSRRRVALLFLLREVMPYPDGFQVLGSVVSALEGETRHMARVRTAIALAEVPVFPPDSWERLMELLGGLEVLDIVGAFRAALGLPPEDLPQHCTEPWSAVLYAATLNARPGEPLPCVLLVELFARLATGQQQKDLLNWATEHRLQPDGTGRTVLAVDGDGPADSLVPVPADGGNGAGVGGTPDGGARHGDHHGSTRTAVAPPQVVAPAVWAPGACLLIRLRPLPDPDHEGELLLSYWRQTGGPAPYPVRGGDLRVDVAELPEHVKTLVEQAETGWAYFWKEDLTLEFLFPRDLLDLPVEQWEKRGFLDASGTLGEDHPVVLRSLERMERADTHGRWAKRWDALVADRGGPVHWFPADGRARLLTDPPPVVVVLSDPPGRPKGHRAGVDELGESLRAGVPIVIWDRRGGIDPAFRDELLKLTARQGIRQLPDAVRSLRIEAGGEDPEGGSSMLGRHAALLWDDPYRLPGERGDAADTSAQGGG
ncbi:hypothetical protein ACH41E_07020 [Streptomyces sp. NPDC020412]|uniref:VMAP-C domain-containing protein n=1 Tax=Streptomyces sp. NPDC020412 TaxID=3365073 RepID=UPI0037998278